MTIQNEFDPRKFLTFQDGVNRVQEALARTGIKNLDSQIMTSRDDNAAELQSLLKVTNIPKGFTKWQLPIVLDRAQMFISVAEPGVKVPAHVHQEGAGVRFIVSGSIRYNGQELVAGDWMYIPAGLPYSIEVGRMGAVMCYCYACCCA